TVKTLNTTFNFDNKFDKLVRQILNPGHVIIKGFSFTYLGFLYALWHANKTNKLQVNSNFTNGSIEHLIFELFSFMWSSNDE
ncbi:MAG: hypothetical protein PHC75_05120, partial [Burkholderiales bacterium]|nr:hypothetical protein [Burkholderiales bacterium]